MRFWFVCTRNYWLGYSAEERRAKLKKGELYEDIDSDVISRARLHSAEHQCIQTVKLSKSYKDQTALRELTIEMRNGEVSTYAATK